MRSLECVLMVMVALGLGGAPACGGDDGATGARGEPGAPGPSGEAGEPGAEGPEGPQGDGPAASIAGVLPARVFRERTVELVIAGDNTEWTEGVELDLGDDVEIDALTVASPTSLRATVTFGAAATIGARDVVVSEGEASFTYAAAFRVDPALAVDAGAVAVSQGGIVPIRLLMLDPATPFDTTDDGGGFPYLGVDAEGVAFVVEDVRPYDVRALALVDVFAASGGRDVTVTSGIDDRVVASTGETPFEVEERASIALEDGTTGLVGEAFGTALYVYQPPAETTLVTLSVSTEAAPAAPSLALLPASGAFADLMDFDDDITFVTDGSGDPYYVVFFDNLGAFDYDFAIALEEQAAPGNVESEPNDLCAEADPIPTGEPVLAALGGADDVDLFVVEAGADDVGRVVHVLTSPGDPNTDTVVEVLRANCTTSMGGQSLDFGYHEDHRSTPVVAAGPIFVRVTSSSFGFSQSDYQLTVTFEEP